MSYEIFILSEATGGHFVKNNVKGPFIEDHRMISYFILIHFMYTGKSTDRYIFFLLYRQITQPYFPVPRQIPPDPPNPHQRGFPFCLKNIPQYFMYEIMKYLSANYILTRSLDLSQIPREKARVDQKMAKLEIFQRANQRQHFQHLFKQKISSMMI